MKIYRNGIEIELTAEEIRQAHDEYNISCKMEDVVGKFDELYPDSYFKIDEKLQRSLANEVEDALGKNDIYYEAYWTSVENVLENNLKEILFSQPTVTPEQYLLFTTGKEHFGITNENQIVDILRDFDDELRDYSLDDADEAIRNNEHLLVVEFPDSSKRIFETHALAMKAYELHLEVESMEKKKRIPSLNDKIFISDSMYLQGFVLKTKENNVGDYLKGYLRFDGVDFAVYYRINDEETGLPMTFDDMEVIPEINEYPVSEATIKKIEEALTKYVTENDYFGIEIPGVNKPHSEKTYVKAEPDKNKTNSLFEKIADAQAREKEQINDINNIKDVLEK